MEINNLRPEEKLNNFRIQIERDLKDIEKEYSRYDPHVSNFDYSFLYWVLLKLFNIEEENITDYITEYNDKGIDCFVNFEETKELFIIQCKHYEEETKVIRNTVADFLKSPLSFLDNNKYTRSKELKKIYNKAKNDSEYKIYMQFYTTNTKYSDDISLLISEFNSNNKKLNKNITAQFIDLKDIYYKYYGESYKKSISLKFNLKTLNKGTFASIREEYGINYKYQGYYIITPVEQIYELLKTAREKGYSLFEENIREYLGESGSINSAIIKTLKSEEKTNFLYYNNGITLIAKSAKTQTNQGKGNREIELNNPQIVNGCQTVNTIFKVLDEFSEKERKEEYKDVFVMTKLLVIPTNDDKDKEFYHNVVKYTNKQNPIPDKVFAANNSSVFTRIQKEVKRYGLWIKVKQSDKIKFDNFSSKEKAEMKEKINEISKQLGIEISQKDLCVDLEKILQICLAFITDGYNAYTKKSYVLKTDSSIFKNYSINIQDYLSYENIVRLYVLYKLAEKDKKNSEDQRTPIPYYILGFLSYHIKDKEDKNCYNKCLDRLFLNDENTIKEVYKYLVNLCSVYSENSEKDYNVMIKQKIETDKLDKAINTCKRFMGETYKLISQ